MPKSEPDREAASSSAIADLWHRFRWPIIAVVLVSLAAGARFEQTQPLEAMLVGLAAPLGALAMGTYALRDSARWLRIFAVAVAFVALVGAELEIGHLFFPPAALATGSLSTKEPDATLALPGGQADFEFETHGVLGSGRNAAEENFVIELERDGQKRQIEGNFSRSGAVRFTRRRAPTGTSPHTVDVDRQPVTLAGSGPLRVHLITLTGSGGRTLEVSVRPALPGGRLLEMLLKGLLAAAIVVQVAAAREGLRARFAAWVGIAIVLSLYLPHHFSPEDPLGAMTGAIIVALIVGGIGGLLVGGLVSSIAGKRATA